MTNPDSEQTADTAKTLGVDRAGAWKPRLKRWLWGGGAAVAVLAIWLIRETRSQASLVEYRTQPVRRADLVVTVSATGRLEPLKEVDVGIEVSGTIKTVEADYNDRVKVGQVLARLDTSRLEAQALQSEASLEAARARVVQAQAIGQEAETHLARLTRLRELSGGKMPALGEVESAEATLARTRADEASAKASVAQAQAALDVTRTDLSKAVICSPINGVVLRRGVEPGQTVAATFQSPVLFTLAEDLAQLELQVDVDEADVGRVKSGQEATFTVDAYPDRTFPALITQVRFGSETVNGVVTYKTVLQVDNSSLTLLPGMTATAVIVVKNVTSALLVPNAALRFTPPEKPTPGTARRRGLVGALFPHPRVEPRPTAGLNENSKTQQVWTVRSGQLTALAITKGATDGVLTEVTDGALEPGMEVATDTVTVNR